VFFFKQFFDNRNSNWENKYKNRVVSVSILEDIKSHNHWGLQISSRPGQTVIVGRRRISLSEYNERPSLVTFGRSFLGQKVFTIYLHVRDVTHACIRSIREHARAVPRGNRNETVTKVTRQKHPHRQLTGSLMTTWFHLNTGFFIHFKRFHFKLLEKYFFFFWKNNIFIPIQWINSKIKCETQYLINDCLDFSYKYLPFSGILTSHFRIIRIITFDIVLVLNRLRSIGVDLILHISPKKII